MSKSVHKDNCNIISEEDDDFDAMAKDYNDESFNSYKTGVGSYIDPKLQLNKRREGENRNYKLYIGNIPLGINNAGLENIFCNFGKVLDTFLALVKSGNCKYGFIQYKTLREAERAIYNVNGVKPLNLTVKFAYSKEAKANRDQETKFETACETMETLPTPPPSKIVRGRGLILPVEGIKAHTMPCTYTWYTPWYHKMEEEKSSRDWCVPKRNEIIDNYNEILNYEKPVVSNKYLMYMGRGYAIKNIIHHKERYNINSTEDYTWSNEDSDTAESFRSGKCQVCNNTAMRICFNCSRWYCSKPCFRHDSPYHTVEASGLVLCHSNVSNTMRPVYVKKLIFPPINHPLQSVIMMNDNVSLDTDRREITLSNRNSHNTHLHFISSRKSSNLQVKYSDKIDVNEEMKQSLSDGCPLPPNVFTLVRINESVEDSPYSYWVNNMNSICELIDISKSIEKFCQNKSGVVNLNLNELYTVHASSQSFWYRCRLLQCLDGLNVKVLLIDIGREEIYSIFNVMPLPHNLMLTPPLSFKIKFNDGSGVKYSQLAEPDEVNVKPLFQESDGCIVVQAEDSNEENQQVVAEVNQTNIGPLPFNSYTEVKISVVENNERGVYWVNPLSIWNELSEMTLMLNMIGNNDKTNLPVKPALNQLYIHNYQQVWCRAQVMSLDPLIIFYIDYGNSNVLDICDHGLKPLPMMMQSHRFPPMAVKIILSEKTDQNIVNSFQPCDQIFVKPIKLSQGVEVESGMNLADMFSYHVILEDDDTHSSINSSSSIDNINLEVEEKHLVDLAISRQYSKIELLVTNVISSTKISASLIVPNNKIFSIKQIEQSVMQAYSQNSNLHIEKDGILIGCLTCEGIYARGFISCKDMNDTNNIRVALVDYGCVSRVDKMFELTEKLKMIPEAAVSCVFTSSVLQTIKVGCKIKCKVIKSSDNELVCDAQGLGECTISTWYPRFEDNDLSCIRIETGTKVRISSYTSPKSIFIQSLDNKHVEMLDTLLQDVASFALQADELKREPEMGEIVCALYPEDQNYYRGQVYRKRNNLYSVLYLDFGNSYDIDISNIKPLSLSLKMVPCCAVEIGLKDIAESIMTADAVFYLNNLCSQTLFLEYHESEHGAELNRSILKTKQGESVNEAVNRMVSLKWISCLQSGEDPTNGEVFFGSDIKYIKWSVKSKLKLLIVTKHSYNSYLVINTSDSMLHFIRDYYTRRISDYCNSFSIYYKYVPRCKEICFVKHDGNWFRAVCTDAYSNSCWVVFIDFGNRGEIYYENVRPMTYEFMQTPAILKKCTIQGVEENCLDDDMKTKLDEILLEGSLHEATIQSEVNMGVVTAHFHSLDHLITLPPVKD